jgi:hypothetical protein
LINDIRFLREDNAYLSAPVGIISLPVREPCLEHIGFIMLQWEVDLSEGITEFPARVVEYRIPDSDCGDVGFI